MVCSATSTRLPLPDKQIPYFTANNDNVVNWWFHTIHLTDLSAVPSAGDNLSGPEAKLHCSQPSLPRRCRTVSGTCGQTFQVGWNMAPVSSGPSVTITWQQTEQPTLSIAKITAINKLLINTAGAIIYSLWFRRYLDLDVTIYLAKHDAHNHVCDIATPCKIISTDLYDFWLIKQTTDIFRLFLWPLLVMTAPTRLR